MVYRLATLSFHSHTTVRGTAKDTVVRSLARFFRQTKLLRLSNQLESTPSEISSDLMVIGMADEPQKRTGFPAKLCNRWLVDSLRKFHRIPLFT
jgi:hypothetical protein